MDEVTEDTVTEHTVTLKVLSDVDPAELLDIMIALRENIIEMVEQQGHHEVQKRTHPAHVCCAEATPARLVKGDGAS